VCERECTYFSPYLNEAVKERAREMQSERKRENQHIPPPDVGKTGKMRERFEEVLLLISLMQVFFFELQCCLCV